MPPPTALSVLEHPTRIPPQAVQETPKRALFTTGYAGLDALDIIRPGRITQITGDADAALYPLIASATRSGTALIIDGGNNIDAYAIVDAGSRSGMASDEALARVFVARAFTPYQMEALVERVVPEWLANGPPEHALHRDELSLVVINDLAAQYLDPDTPEREGNRLHKRATRKIRDTSRRIGQRVPIVLATRESAYEKRAVQMLAEQRHASDDLVSIQFPNSLGARKIHVPTRGATLLEREPGVTQRTITDWLTAEA